MAKIITSLFGSLAMSPLQVEVPMVETIEFKTDVIISHNGTEQTLKLRSNPRHKLRCSTPEQIKTKPQAFIAQYGALDQQWAAPVWSEAQRLGIVASGVTALACTTDNYDFRASSLALLYESNTKYQVIEISTVGSGVLNLLAATQAFTNPWLMPIRRAYIEGEVSRKTNGLVATSEVTYSIEDLITLPEIVPVQFKSDDIYFEPTLTDDGFRSTEIKTRVDIHDEDLGIVNRRYPWTHNRVIRSNQFLLTTPQEMRSFKSWIMRRAGKFRRYWEPSFENDLRIKSTGTLTSTIVIEADGIADWGTILRPNIALELSSGTWLTRTVTGVTIGANATLTLDSPLNIDASLIKRTCFLGLHRLDSDSFEINWIGNNVAKCSIRSIEIQP